MATSWKSQQGNGVFALQFETDHKEKYKLVEWAAQMAVDGKTIVDLVPRSEFARGIFEEIEQGLLKALANRNEHQAKIDKSKKACDAARMNVSAEVMMLKAFLTYIDKLKKKYTEANNEQRETDRS